MAVKRSPTGAGARLYVADGSTTVTDLHGLGTFVDKYNPTPAELVARDSAIAEWASWVLTCPVNVDHTGGTETADDSDRCNPDATIVTKVTSEITFNFRKKKDSSNDLPNWVRFLRAAWKSGGLVHLMMLDAPKTQDGADGFWMIAQVIDYSESQQLTEGIEISCTVRPGSTPTDVTGVPYLNWDVMTVSVP